MEKGGLAAALPATVAQAQATVVGPLGHPDGDFGGSGEASGLAGASRGQRGVLRVYQRGQGAGTGVPTGRAPVLGALRVSQRERQQWRGREGEGGQVHSGGRSEIRRAPALRGHTGLCAHPRQVVSPFLQACNWRTEASLPPQCLPTAENRPSAVLVALWRVTCDL